MVLRGQVFLPHLPAAHSPLAEENPAAALEALRDQNVVLGDRVFPFLTDQIAMRAEVLSGDLPTWEPLQALGMPLIGGTIAGGLYPPNWIAFLLPPERAAAPLACLSLLLAGLGLYLFLARLGLDRRACLAGAIACELGGWGLANLFYYMKVDAALWLAWALWAVEGLARGKRWSAFALTLSLALSFLAGMVTIALFVFGATALYALVRLAPRARSAPPRESAGSLVRAGLLLAFGIAGGAAALLPLAEAARASLRQGSSGADIVELALALPAVTGIVVPDLVGPPTDTTPQGDLPLAWWLTPPEQHARAERANALEWNTYALAGAFLLALVGCIATPRRAAFPALFVVLVLAFACGLFPRFVYGLPGLDLGAPGRVLALAWILWPWLAALGVQALLERRERALGTLLAASFVLTCAAFVAKSGLEPERWASELPHTLVARYGERFGTTLAEVTARIPSDRALFAARHLEESLGRTLAAAGSLLVAGILMLVLDRRRARFEHGAHPAAIALGVVLVLALALVPALASDAPAGPRGVQGVIGLCAAIALAALALRRVDRADLVLWLPLAAALLVEGALGARGHVGGRALLSQGVFPPSPTIEAIRRAAGDGRVLRLDTSPSGLEHVVRLARPNMLVPYGIHELTPYPTFTPRQLTELVSALDPTSFYRNHVSHLSRPELLGSPLLDLLRVQCILAVTPLAHERLVPELERQGFCVYRRTGALPEARIVPRAVVAASDTAAVGALVSEAADYLQQTWIAPEHAALAQDVAPANGEDGVWQPGTVEVEHPAKNALLVRVHGTSGGWLVLHEQYAPGWVARVDGQETPVLRADHAYRAVRVSAGDPVVEFRYAPRSLANGTLVSLLALAGALVLELRGRPPARTARD